MKEKIVLIEKTISVLKEQLELVKAELEYSSTLSEKVQSLQEAVSQQAEWLATAHVVCNVLLIPMDHISKRLPLAIDKLNIILANGAKNV